MKRAIFLLALFAVAALPVAAQQYDVVIAGGRIVDGSGNPWYVADVGIREGRIAAIGRLCASDGDAGAPACPAKRTLDARGLYVTPGFIDVHTHSEQGIQERAEASNFLFDGVTSIVSGNCGGSDTNLAEVFAQLRSNGISINYSTLIGHNAVRRAVMGTEQRDPTPEEQGKMEALVEQAMREGAVGLSTGLIYVPGTYSKTPEVVGLAKAAARYNGVYASHIRNEGTEVLDAIAEAITIGREAALPVEISHFKVANKKIWGDSDKTIALVERARAEGLDVTVDQYPYTASSTNLGVLLPSWALAGGPDEIKKRLADPTLRKRIAREMKEQLKKRNGRKRYDYAFVSNFRADASLNGKSITQITKERGGKNNLNAEIETVLQMMEQGGASMVYHSMSEKDVVRIMQFPYSMVASDAGILEFGRGVPHPRGYGTNARVLARYVREQRAIRLEEAIRKMTSLPAQRFRLTERGLVRPGMWADVAVFDAAKVSDAATFEKPHAYAEGFRYVLVNGVVTIEEGKHTGARAGQVLLGPGAARDEVASRRTQVEVIRHDQLAVLSIDNGRTRVLYTSSLVEQGGAGYRDLGPLLVFAYDEVQPGGGFKLHSHENVEVITIVLEGSLDHEDTAGHSGRVKTGEVALMSAGSGVKHSEFGNPDVLTRSVTIWLKPRTMNKAPYRATAKPIEKDGWQLIAAERDAPLTVEQDARVLMKRLAAREHVRLVSKPGRMFYMGTVDGELVVGGHRLSVPERIIMRGGEISIASDEGATVVVVDVPLK